MSEAFLRLSAAGLVEGVVFSDRKANGDAG
jgi:hypothetical protein